MSPTMWSCTEPFRYQREQTSATPSCPLGRKKTAETAATCGMIESIRNFINQDKVQVLMPMGDSWRVAFNDWAARVHPKDKEQCARL